MYYKIPGGHIEEIPNNDGFIFKCWVPPVGWGKNIVTGELEEIGVWSRSNKKAEQFWEPRPLPKDYKKRREEESRRQKTDSEYYDPVLLEHERKEWQNRLCGCWFKNNGVDTYITQLHWFYVSHWNMDIGLPNYREPDRKFFYALGYCIEDPYSFGLNDAEKRRGGKCFKINTLIRMYDGSTRFVQDVKEGDLVMGNDSTPRIAYGITSGQEEMFEIIPNRGESFTVNRSHILHCEKSAYFDDGRIERRPINITVNDYLKLSNSQKHLLTIVRTGWGEWAAKKHLVDPYFLGVWLGDGSSSGMEICNEDQEIVTYLKEFSEKHSLGYKNYGALSKSGNKLRHGLGQPKVNVITYNEPGVGLQDFPTKQALMRYLGKHIKTPLKTWGEFKNGNAKIKETKTNIVWDEFKRLNVVKNKHIPDEYYKDSRENRLLLLAGLIDTDGYLDNRQGPKYYKLAFSNKNPRLINDVINLIRSLGFACNVRKESNADATALLIFGELWEIPCKVKRRKADKVVRKFNSLRTGFKVESRGLGDYYGFAVNKNHLFLLHDGTVVHNTYRLTCFIYEDISRTPDSEGGIQSKTATDAKEVVFKKALISPFKKLVDYFRPIFDTAKGLTPINDLAFRHTTTKGRRAFENIDKAELNSTIDWASSETLAYDGRKKRRKGDDETGKSKEVDIYERHQVTRYCLETDGKVTGKALYTTTVEDMDSGGKPYLRLWKASNASKRDENGHTESGLYNYFIPAYETLFFDKHGFPDQIKAREYFENRRRGLMHDPNALCAEIRKNPFTVAEMFIIDGDTCMYNAMKLNEWRSTLSWNTDFIERGNFEWKDGERDSTVIWVPNKSGRWEICRGFNPDPKEINNVVKRGNLFYPQNDFRFGSGVDPYDHDLTEDNRRSSGASLVKQKNNLNNHADPLIMAYICKYKYRPSTAELLYEDMIKQCYYFSCQILFESNKPGIMHYFRRRGYGAFLMHLPGYKEPGIPSTPENKQSASEFVEAQIESNIEKVFFLDVIDDWLEMDLKKMQKYDVGAASLWTEMACHNRLIRSEPEKLRSMDDYMPGRKIPGRESAYAIEPIDG